MAKPKMAVRKKSENRKTDSQRDFEFKKIFNLTAVWRWMSVITLVVGLGFAYIFSADLWQKVWPVGDIALQGEIQYLHTDELVNLIEQLDIKGMLAIDLEALQKSAQQLAWVREVEVRKVWPEQIVFTIVEHQPAAKIGQSILTQQGTLIKLDGKFDNKLFDELPLIDIYEEDEIELQTYLSVWNEFKSVKRQFELLSLELLELKVDRVRNWHLTFNNGLQLNLGRKDRADRVERLVKIYASITNKEKIKSIDLRYHNGLAVEWFSDETAELKS